MISRCKSRLKLPWIKFSSRAANRWFSLRASSSGASNSYFDRRTLWSHCSRYTERIREGFLRRWGPVTATTHANDSRALMSRLYYAAKRAAPRYVNFFFFYFRPFWYHIITHEVFACPDFDQGPWTRFNLIYAIESEEACFIKRRVNGAFFLSRAHFNPFISVLAHGTCLSTGLRISRLYVLTTAIPMFLTYP